LNVAPSVPHRGIFSSRPNDYPPMFANWQPISAAMFANCEKSPAIFATIGRNGDIKTNGDIKKSGDIKTNGDLKKKSLSMPCIKII